VRLFLSACSLLLSACAADCGSDWYQVGQRDGRMGASPQVGYYADRCGGQVDTARYNEGYRAGFALRPPPNW
jgi:hypothetical protein